jgi:hypothetical protein
MPRKQQVKKQAAKRKRQAEEEVIEEPLPTYDSNVFHKCQNDDAKHVLASILYQF